MLVSALVALFPTTTNADNIFSDPPGGRVGASNASTDQAPDAVIDHATLARWSAPYRRWHYWPDHVVPARPVIGQIDNLLGTDVPTVYQIPGCDRYFMSFIGFDGRGYQSFVAESDDLVNWGNYRLAMGYGPAGTFDHGGCVIGAFLYESYDIKAPRLLKKRDGGFWTLYGSYPRQGGYELRPGYEGVAVSDDGLAWRRAKDQPILSVHDLEPLYKAGGNPSGLDKPYAHKISLVHNPKNETFYLFYNARPGKGPVGGRGIGLITSKPIEVRGKRHDSTREPNQ